MKDAALIDEQSRRWLTRSEIMASLRAAEEEAERVGYVSAEDSRKAIDALFASFEAQ